jgi:hypothetical protein
MPARGRGKPSPGVGKIGTTDKTEAHQQAEDLVDGVPADVHLRLVEDDRHVAPCDRDVDAAALRILADTGDVGPVWMAKNELHARRTSRRADDQPPLLAHRQLQMHAEPSARGLCIAQLGPGGGASMSVV